MAAHKPNRPTPPRWLDRLLERFCAPHLLEEVLGDLHERYYLRVQRVGEAKANQQYWREVLAYLRPSVIKRPASQPPKPIPMDMLKNYFTIALRNLRKHQSFAVINIAGLTLGLSCALVIFMIVRFELSFDTFHTKADRIYRVITGSTPSDSASYGTGTPHGLASILQEDFPEVEKVGVIYHLNTQKTQIEVDHNLVNAPHTYFVTPSFFDMFDFTWVVGNPQQSLSQPGQVVISQTLANQYFQGDAMGQRIRLNNEFDLVVSGILQDVPENTDFPIQLAVSHATFATSEPFQEAYSESHGSAYHTYLLLNKKASPAALESKFPAMVEKYLGKDVAENYLAHTLQPLHDVHFNEALGGGNFSDRAVSKTSLWSLSLIGGFILIMASINFVNLATAQAIRRSKEVGIRKVMGSTRRQLFLQFIGETFTLTFIATVLSLVLVSLLLPSLNSLLDIPLDENVFSHPYLLLWLGMLCGVISLLAGCYPALVLSSFKPVLVIKNAMSQQPSGGLLLRKGLITFQFVITQVLIIATLVVVSQNHYFRTQSLGYHQEAVLTVDVPEQEPQKIETLRNRLSQHPEIQGVSFSMNAPSATSNKWWNYFFHASDPQEGKLVEVKPVDDQYLALYNITLLAGDLLRPGDSSILVNEAFLKEIGMADPQGALQEVVTIGGQDVTIKGIVRDFHTLSLHQKINPLMMVYMEDKFQLASIRIRMAEAQEAITIVEGQWKEAFPQYYFSYRFLDDDLASWYEKERKTSRLLSLFAGIAIFISCLGLYGLISFITAQKTKEVGIRKVLGATVSHIVYLFTKDFVLLVAIAFGIAAPLGYYFMQQWLADFTYKIDLSWWMFAVAVLVGLVIAMITISFQSIKAALANLVDSLRNE